MTDNEETNLLASKTPYRQGDLVLYDYFKHLTTLSLLVLGGVLTLSQTDHGAEMKLLTLLMVVGVVTLAGVVSFSASGEIARAHFHGAEAGRPVPQGGTDDIVAGSRDVPFPVRKGAGEVIAAGPCRGGEEARSARLHAGRASAASNSPRGPRADRRSPKQAQDDV